jgi:hypothetical protein
MNRWLIGQRSKGPDLPPEKIKLLESLPLWSWDPSSERHEAGIAILKTFIERFGHSKVPQDWPEQENVNLFVFVNSARGTYRSGEMPAERIRAFESLVGWSWNLTETGWSQRLSDYRDFYSSFKRNPSRESEDSQEKRLAYWAKHQKELFRSGKLSPDKIKELDSLREWQWESSENWDDVYQDLYEFIVSEGKNPQKGVRGKRTSLRLDSWYSTQKKNLDKLSLERQSKLRSLPNFTPFTQLSQSWPKKFLEVQKFLKKNGRLPKYRTPDKHEAGLGLWLTRQKTAFVSLSEDKKRALEDLPGFKVITSSADGWQEYFNQLQVFVKTNGGSLPTRKSELKLANWMYRQSAKFHKLPADQQKKLNSISEFHRLILGKSKLE